VVASVASFGSPSLTQGAMARAVSPAAAAAVLRDRPPQAAGAYAVSTVALAPAAMSALIEAQERLAQDAPPLDRTRTARRIDQLLNQFAAADGPGDPNAATPFAVRRLQTVRAALSPAFVDLQA